jgi:hypothetical protein
VRSLYGRIAVGYFVVATVLLMLLALALLAIAVWEIGHALVRGDVLGLLDGAGLVIVGFAIIETSKFVAEEELLRSKELRSAVESRRSLTKFITIIVIAVSLEALVMVFEAGRGEEAQVLYPTALFGTAMFALVALGVFQWLSSRIAPPPDPAEGGGIDHREAEAPEA